jgi:manganese transport protein
MFCRDPTLMGNLVNSRLTSWAAYAVAGLIIGLNVYLLYQTFVPTA